ncbi:MAG: family 43 glycosylhydrolase [Planctomycetaceae bacterium]|nr:family 43 glycosylhydrolase [Planctomycetaceae bacterium]
MSMLSGNPILPGVGVCDPHVRIYDGRAYLYATHDKSPDNTSFVMDDWWIWSSPDLVRWTHECSIRPEQTYYGRPDSSCWAVDAIARGGRHYFYFSRGPAEIGVVEADTPVGPWRDPLQAPLIADGAVAPDSRDPGLFLDDDGEAYIVFGTWTFYIARLKDSMVALAERPRTIEIIEPQGPYGAGKTDDKPYLHKRGGIYYLSWGCYYGMSENLYGPYRCCGSIVLEENVEPEMRYKSHGLTYDRHGSFFQWRGQWYFICNDMSRIGNPVFRDSCLCYVNYRPDGSIEPVKITAAGVTLPPP